MSKAKKIGTEGETAVVNALHRLGWEDAKRIILAGYADECDVTIHPKFAVAQVKAGHYAERASLEQIWAWLNQTEQQRVDARVPWAILVTKRVGYGHSRADQWWAYLWLSTFVGLVGAPMTISDDRDHPVRMVLREASILLHTRMTSDTLEGVQR